MSDTLSGDEGRGAARNGDGLASLSDEMLHTVVRAVRFESDGLRDRIHLLRRVGSCDRTVRVGGGQLVVNGECLCGAMLVEMLVEADGFLRAQPPGTLHNPPGAVRAHVRRRLPDWTRRRRVEMGAHARPERLRHGRMAAGLPDAYHAALLHYLAAEAGSLAPLGDESSLLRRLAMLAADEFGGPATEHLPRVVRGVAVVEAVCRRRMVAPFPGAAWRTTWWQRYIEEPLGRRPRFDDVPLHSSVPNGVASLLDRLPERDDDDPGDRAVATVLRVIADGTEVDARAMQAAAAELLRTRQLSSAAAARFVADPDCLQIAAEQVRVLLAA